MTIALIFSLDTCIVQIRSVWVKFACTKRLFNLLAEAIINVRNVQNTKCLGELCLHKKNFQSLGRSDYQCPQCGSVCQVRNIPFEDQTNSFFLSFGQGVYIFEENLKSIQDVIGDVYCPGKYCSNSEKSEPLDGYITTPRSIYG